MNQQVINELTQLEAEWCRRAAYSAKASLRDFGSREDVRETVEIWRIIRAVWLAACKEI